MEDKIFSFVPRLEKQDISEVTQAVSIGWGENREFYIRSLEESLRSITNRKFALAVSHGSDAIHLSLSALGLEPGDEIIVPDLTWVACVSPIIHLGLTPVFVNVDESMCMDPNSFNRAITTRTKAVIVVDLAGSLPKWDEILKVAKQHNILIIEDAAESLGGNYKENPAGSFGDVSILSFSGTKVVTGGHGGAVITNSEQIYNKMKLLYHHGIDQELTGKYYWSTEAGYNFQLSNIQAALINSQLSRLSKLVDFKRNLYNSYREELNGINSIELISPMNNVNSSFWLIVAIINPKLGLSKEEVIFKARQFGVDIRPFFYLLSTMPPFVGYRVEVEENRLLTERLSNFGICLPYGYDMTDSKVKKVVNVLKKILV